MPTTEDTRAELLALLRQQSVFHGDFTLSSGARSTYYIDCRLTTLDPRGAWLVGRLLHSLIRREADAKGLRIEAVGGLTMGADPVALSIAMISQAERDTPPWQAFVVRKTPKAHGQTKLIEGNFHPGNNVVVVDDVVTTGDSTVAAINAVTQAGGVVALVAVLVDRQQGGRERIEALGHRVIAAFQRDDLLGVG